MKHKIKGKFSTLFMLVILFAQTLTPVVTVFAEDTTSGTQASSEVQSVNETLSSEKIPAEGVITTSASSSTSMPTSENKTASTSSSTEPSTSASSEVAPVSPEATSATEESTEEDEEPAQSSTGTSESTVASAETSEKESTDELPKEIKRKARAISQNIITNFKITDRFGNEGTQAKPLNPNSPEGVSVHFEWALPAEHEYQKDDTFVFSLPDLFEISGEMEGTLSNGTTNFGKYVIDKEGKVTLTFNENIGQDEVKGTVQVDTWIDIQKLENETIKVIESPISGDEKNYVLYLESANGKLINKSGTIDKGFGATSATWNVDINTGLEKLVNPSVSDKIPTGMKYKENSFEVITLSVGLDGTIKETTVKLSSDKYEITGNLDVVLKNLTEEESYQAYRLKYETEIVDSNLEGTKTWTNEAILTNNGTETGSVKSSVSSDYGEELTKSNLGYNDKEQTFDWEILYNLSGKTITKDKAIIEDTWTPKGSMELNKFKVYSVTLDESGNVIASSKTEVDSSQYDMKPKADQSGFEFTFNQDVSSAYVIEYETKLIQNNGEILTQGGTIQNEVTSGTGKTSGSEGTFTQPGIIKTSPGYDVKEKTIDWEIKINQNNYQMNNLMLEDKFVGDGLTLKEDTFQLIDGSGQSLVRDKDYQLKVNPPAPGNPGSFKVTFQGNYASTKESFTLSYQTNFERNSDGSAIYKNKADIKWKEGGIDYSTNTAEVEGTPSGHTGPNGVKSGTFNPVDKQITWEINTNYARLDISAEDYRIEDLLDASQEYVEGSLEVYTYTINAKGEIISKTPITSDYSLKQSVEGNKNKLTVIFQESARKQGTIGIQFKTKFKNNLITETVIENTATVFAGTKEYKLKAETTAIDDGNNFANKSGKQTGNRINWEIELNPNGSKVDDFTLMDTVAVAGEPYSVFIADSVKLYSATINSDGSLTRGNQVLSESSGVYTFKDTSNPLTGEQSFELKFNQEINEPYILTYDTFIDVSGIFTISNQYEIFGNNIETIKETNSEEVPVKMSGSSGSGQGTVGSLKIVKQEENGQTAITGEIAKEASFELWNAAGDVRIRQAVHLDSNGELTFANIRSSQYRIVEVTPPTGYTINSEYANRGGNDKGMLVDLKDLEAGIVYPFAAKDPHFKVILEKKSETGAPLNGAIFDLYDGTTDAIVSQYQDLEIKKGGKLELNIDPAHIGNVIELGKEYYVKEKQAVGGYLLNTQPSARFVFELNSNGTQTVPTVTIINYQGSVQWKKTNKNDIGLANAVFEVLDENGVVVPGKTGKTDANGIVTISGLAPGKYKLREKTAPADYIKNPTPSSEFTIDASANGKPETIVLAGSLVNYQRKAKMRKTDKSDNSLAGAQFIIKKLDGDKANHFYNGINENGTINWVAQASQVTDLNKFISDPSGIVTGPLLGLGKYQFVEVEAPTGYIINTKGIVFEITATNNQTDAELPVVDKTATPLINYKGSIELTKKGYNNTPLSDVEFRLLDSDKKPISGQENLKTDANGKIKIEELAPGKYYFEELKAADGGYVLNKELLEFTVPERADENTAINLTKDFINYRGKATLMKTLANEPAGSSVGKTAQFYFKDSTGKFYQGIDSEGAAIFNTTATEITVSITGNQGIATVEGLAPGNYSWEEVVAPIGYLLNTEKQNVTVGTAYQGEPTAEAASMTNYQGSAELSKINESNQGIDLTKSGVEFKVYKKGDLSTTAVGQITYTADGKVQVSHLAPGTYTIEEIVAPKDYVRNPTTLDFEILASALGEPVAVTQGLTLTNYQGSAEFEKKDSQKNPINLNDTSAVFKVYQVQTDGTLGAEPQGTVTITDHKVKVTGLGSGNYQFVEVTAPTGYIINTKGPTFKIEDETNKELALLTGMELINYQGSAQLVKKSGEQLVAGAEFKVVDSKNNEIKTNLISNDQGVVSVEGLAPGKYGFVETKPAPGYVLDTTKKEFEIVGTYEGLPITVSVGELNNTLTSFTFTKHVEAKQGLTTHSLKDVVFTIKNRDGKHYNGSLNQPSEAWVDTIEQVSDEVKASLTSDANGKVNVNGLTPGTYTIEEVDVPTGIVKKEGTVLTVTISESGAASFANNESTIVNERETTTSISGQKTWIDDSNVFNTRPADITLTLYRQIGEGGTPAPVPGSTLGTNYTITVSGTDTEKWDYEFTNLVTHNDSGEPYIFTVKEEAISGYTATYNGMNVTNTLVPTSVSGKKTWLGDDSVKDLSRPKSITLTLQRDGSPATDKDKEIITATATAPDWNYEFTDLPKFKEAGDSYKYTVVETDVPGYEKTPNGMNVTNTFQPMTIEGEKKWSGDDKNIALTRPDKITIELYRNGTTDPVATQEITGPDWKYQFNGLPEFDGQEAYEYTVKEVEHPGYSSVTSNDNKIVTNTLNLTSVPVQKVWNDATDPTARPESVTVELLRQVKGEDRIDVVTEETLKAEATKDTWNHEFTGLPTHNKDGKPFIYSVRETNVPAGYNATQTIDKDGVTHVIINTLIPEGVFFATKIWDDGTDTSIRPDSIQVQLFRQAAGSTKEEKVGTESTIAIKDEQNPLEWQTEFTGLASHDALGKEYTYFLKEITKSGSYLEPTVNQTTITNTLETINNISVEKIWNDKSDISIRENEVIIDLHRTSDPKVEPVPVDGHSLWLSQFNNWQSEFTGLAKADQDGKEFIYSIKERGVSGYTTKITGSQTEGFKVTNTLELTQVNVTKNWSDYSNKFGLRPDAIHLQLMKRVGKELVPVEKQTIDSNGEIKTTIVEMTLSDTVKENNQQSAVFSDLTKYDENGDEIQYAVTETPVTGYETSIVSLPNEIEGEQYFEITNTLETTKVHVTKNWSDFDNKFGLRPENIKVDLYQDGTKVLDTLVPVAELNSTGKWAYTFDNLPKYNTTGSEVKEYVYTIKERSVSGYASTIVSSPKEAEGEQHFEIANTLETTKVHVTKNWSDFDNKFGLRPENIKVDLYQDGTKVLDTLVPAAELNSAGKWAYTFDNLPKYNTTGSEVKEYVYTIKERKVLGYESIIVSSPNEIEGEPHFEITNNLETISVPVKKIWKDTFKETENYYKSRPESITIRLLQGLLNDGVDGVEIEQIPAEKLVAKAGVWSHTFEGLPKYNTKGEEYIYTIKEDAVDKYNQAIKGNTKDGFEVTNTRKTYAIGDYTWVDTNQDGIQDANEEILAGVTVELYDASGKKIDEKTTNKEGLYIFDELESGDYTIKFILTDKQKELYEFTKQDSGKDNKVDSDADHLTGWTTTITLNENSKELTKEYKDQAFKATEGIDPTWDAGVVLREKIEITGTKVWIGGPTVKPTIEFQLYRNGEALGEPVELKDGTTTYTWKDLYKTDTNKEAYVYTVQEVGTPSEYNKTEQDLTVTNTRKTYAIGDYTWIDTNKDGIQDKNEPILSGVKVELFDENGKKIAETTTDENGRYLFDELESGKYKVKFTLTSEQKKRYKFTKRHSGDAEKDSNADEEGWTIDIDLNENNAFLTLDYADQMFKASEGIDPTWDAGVVLIESGKVPGTGGDKPSTGNKAPKTADGQKPLPQMGEAGNPVLLTTLGILLIGSVTGVVTARRRRKG
ncbi:Cna B-type domain-containing protein [Enterococcus sp.]|uniref:Cna B-type domain-containing protein n=1 Tax=Enterococcus sp. TaxID=35783 RepID=UPI002FC94837